jgi:hypothetical protein
MSQFKMGAVLENKLWVKNRIALTMSIQNQIRRFQSAELHIFLIYAEVHRYVCTK